MIISDMNDLFVGGFTQHLASRVSAFSGYRHSNAKLGAGFTIIELMIATSVFSILLMVGIAIFLQVGSTYYKGVTISQTSETAKQIMDDVSSNIRLSSSVASATSSSGAQYYCVGNHRYTYNLYKEVQDSTHDFTSNFGLVEDEPAGGGCGDPFGTSPTPFVNPAELLGNNMRLLAFNITNSSGKLYNIQLTLASGDDSSLSSTNSASATCLSGVTDRFCAVTSLQSVVYEGF